MAANCAVCKEQAWYQIYGLSLCINCKKLADKWNKTINDEADRAVLVLLSQLKDRENNPAHWICLECGFDTDSALVADIHKDWCRKNKRNVDGTWGYDG